MTADRISVGELQELLAAGRPVNVLDVAPSNNLGYSEIQLRPQMHRLGHFDVSRIASRSLY